MLDEPTNHMDIVGKESLENMLKEYEGTLIFVSHDRFFVNKIADKILSFEKAGAKFYDCNYSEYLLKKENEIEEVEEKKEKTSKKTYINPLKEKDKLEKKIKKLEEEISKKEEEINLLKIEMTKEEIYSDYIKVAEIQSKIDALNLELENNMLTWEEMQEEYESIKSLFN